VCQEGRNAHGRIVETNWRWPSLTVFTVIGFLQTTLLMLWTGLIAVEPGRSGRKASDQGEFSGADDGNRTRTVSLGRPTVRWLDGEAVPPQCRAIPDPGNARRLLRGARVAGRVARLEGAPQRSWRCLVGRSGGLIDDGHCRFQGRAEPAGERFSQRERSGAGGFVDGCGPGGTAPRR
jgi:hypothetical protein